MKTKLLMLSSVILLGCTKQESPKEEIVYDYSLISEEDIIYWDDLFDQKERRYKVYFYSEYCGYCKQIKEEVISYYLSNTEKLYFLNTDENEVATKINDETLIGCTNIDHFFINGTPFLVNFDTHVVTNYWKGMTQIRDYINKSK